MPGKSLRELRRRIKAVMGIEKLTDAMKKVATARLHRFQRQLLSSRPYTDTLFSMTESILFPSLSHPFFQERKVKRAGIIAITSERGLCGGYNMNIFREVENLAKGFPDVLLFIVGRMGQRHFSRLSFKIAGSFPFPPIGFTLKDVSPIWEASLNSFLKGEIDTLYIVYTHFHSPSALLPATRRLLPLERKAEEREFIFEPKIGVLLDHLLSHYLHTQIYRAILESATSEQSARFIAMDMATQNANRLLHSLRIQYNKERQAQITKEITEIVGGAEVLRRG
ncbi:ATP synthase F1 subunit gamma [bacterium]|nr:ATP synthase F1 subunit gamma [bacterium]